jgi:MOSC domain-containing protein YiiM
MGHSAEGLVEALWLKRAIRGPMDPVDEVTLVAGEGIADDANRGRSQRQVTIIEAEIFDRIRESLPDAYPAMRRANIMLRGVELLKSRDHVLHLGEATVRIRGETRPCERMDEQCDGLRAALEPQWGGGVFGIVLKGGIVAVGAPVSLEPPAPVS